MMTQPGFFRLFVEKICTRLGIGMRAKLITLFIVIKVMPLILLAFVAWRQSWILGEALRQQTETLSLIANQALEETGKIAVRDAVSALDERARENIERMTTDTALAVAKFLYARDNDILLAANLASKPEDYRKFIASRSSPVIQEGKWELAPGGQRWQPAKNTPPSPKITSSIKDNDLNFHYRAPEIFTTVQRPLYREMTFIDLKGRERVKVTPSPEGDTTLRDVSVRENTYIKAETYFPELQKLKPGEIYVSEVIGAYTGSRVIGTYTKESAAKAGEEFAPEQSAYAGEENPLGKRFKGIVRWATPVVEKGEITGYVTLALDHDHLMEFTAHLTPTDERYTELPDASQGNYAFIWDHKGRSIVHPRHFSIAGYNPETGEPEVPWLEDRIYDEWQASGQSYPDFIESVPTFMEQTTSKKPAPALTKKGNVGLDCRYLNFAPQCTGWFDLTKSGGSGSFDILWSGLHKLTTAAAIPYYTGQYSASPRGFGFVTIGAGLDDFHGPATTTQKAINALIRKSDQALTKTKQDAQEAISRNLIETATSLALSTFLMSVVVILIAIWMASTFTSSITTLIKGISRFRKGERHFRFHAPIKDELGTLADSFDEMADSVVNSVKGLLVIIDSQKNILYANDNALEVMGHTLEEILGKPYNQFTVFSDSPYSPIKALKEGREAEMMYYEPANRYYKSTASYFNDKEGEMLGYLIQTTDVTDLAKEQKKIEEQRALLDTIFTSSPDLIWYKDVEGRYLAVNPRAAKLLGMPASRIIGSRVSDLYPPESAEGYHRQDQEVLNRREAVYSEETFIFADGHVETVDSVRTPIFNQRGELVGILGVSRDVSARVAAETALKATQQELEKTALAANKASAAKSEFLARMSHEIRTPMNAIIGMAQISQRKLLESAPNIQEIQAHIRQISISSQHLLGLLNDILDISKIEAGKIELATEIFDLPKLVGHVASIIRPRCLEKHIEFTVSIGPLSAESFNSDSLRLRQVLINLLGNAVKFTPEGGTIDLVITEKERGDDTTLLSFSVKDTGIGMSEEIMNALFTPFEQGSGHIARTYGGTGLGLSISRTIVRLLGGDISVSSTKGEGSVFSFEVPLPRAGEAMREQEKPVESNNLKGKRILLVDDIDINRLIVTEQLHATGLIIDEADDGQHAVEAFAASPDGHYCLILMDVQMPKMNGYEATREIRTLQRTDARSIPIIAMTANAFKEDVDAALLAGMTAHLAKPLENDKLMEMLTRFCGEGDTPSEPSPWWGSPVTGQP